MNWIFEQDKEDKRKSVEALKRLKVEEAKTVLHTQRLNKYTIVSCKRKERLEDYTNL